MGYLLGETAKLKNQWIFFEREEAKWKSKEYERNYMWKGDVG